MSADLDAIYRVEAPAVIPFEPKTFELLEARLALREALGSLPARPGELLHGVAEGAGVFGTDLDNALLYNIGGPQAAPTRFGVLLERRLAVDASTRVVYSYRLIQAAERDGREGRPLVEVDVNLPGGRPRSWQGIWAAIRTSDSVQIVGHAPVGELGVSLVVGAPDFTGSASGEFVKIVVDGVLAALQGHGDSSTVDEIAERMAERTGLAPRQVAASLLDVDRAPLGVCNRLVVPWGSGVQCMPEDQRVGLIRIEPDRTQKAWTLTSSVGLLRQT
jgi:hypothetical protein